MTVSRRAAKVTHDEVTRMVKAVLSLGLPVSSVDFDGSKVSVKIAHSGDKPEAEGDTLIRVPQT